MMIGATLYYLGDQRNARRHLDLAQGPHARLNYRSDIVRFRVDSVVTARSFLARVLWLQGFAERALLTAEENAEAARLLGHALTTSIALVPAIEVALLTGNLTAAARYVAMLDYTASLGMPIWALGVGA
jgi:hypothetical protein